MADKKIEALKIVEEAIKELESTKSSISVAVKKLSRAASLLDDQDIYIWAQIQLANPQYIKAIQPLINEINNPSNTKGSPEYLDKVSKIFEQVKENTGLIVDIHIKDCLHLKSSNISGRTNSVELIESTYLDLVKSPKVHIAGMTKIGLKRHLDYISTIAYSYLTKLHEQLKFSGTISSSFDILKNAVDDQLLDLDLELAEQLMLAFKAVSSDKKEQWSLALTSCRRLLEGLADKLYPATDEVINQRTFKENQHINRLWRFMDVSIESKSNKAVAKTHIDYLGSWLQSDYALTCKGVHAEVKQIEATKTVFHIYLMLADLLEYLDPAVKQTKPSIHTATLDEIEVLLDVKREVAKAIFKARVSNNGSLPLEELAKITGVGPKTLEKAKEVFEF